MRLRLREMFICVTSCSLWKRIMGLINTGHASRLTKLAESGYGSVGLRVRAGAGWCGWCGCWPRRIGFLSRAFNYPFTAVVNSPSESIPNIGNSSVILLIHRPVTNIQRQRETSQFVSQFAIIFKSIQRCLTNQLVDFHNCLNVFMMSFAFGQSRPFQWRPVALLWSLRRRLLRQRLNDALPVAASVDVGLGSWLSYCGFVADSSVSVFRHRPPFQEVDCSVLTGHQQPIDKPKVAGSSLNKDKGLLRPSELGPIS